MATRRERGRGTARAMLPAATSGAATDNIGTVASATVCRGRAALMAGTALGTALGALAVMAGPAHAQPAPNARPAGGVVVGGAAAITQAPAVTTVTQSSQRAAVSWQNFDVGAQQRVTFQQPNAQAMTLNTVRSADPSRIAGRIDANGQVVLVNQSGVTFYRGSQVNTAGLAVSAAGTDPARFMAGGRVVFDRPGNPNARVVNQGDITIGGAGLATLVAPAVANSGTINARLGHVVLAGARTATLDLYGDRMVSVNVTGAVTRAPDGVDALVTNTGVIRADGGTVRLTARAVDGLVTNLVTAGGRIQARTARDGQGGDRTGRIAIDGMGGSITVDGTLDATGRAPGTQGGRIGLLASQAVVVKSGAVVDASGTAGGGTVAVGTTLARAAQGGAGQGGATQGGAIGGAAIANPRMARAVVVQDGARISADATANGGGGRVVLLSSGRTRMAGTLTAKGGAAGGDGGFVEVSGGSVSLPGRIDTGAPRGTAGTLLLDPRDLTISSATDPTITPADADPSIGYGQGNSFPGPAPSPDSIVSPLQLAALTVSKIVLQTSRDLFVQSNVTLTQVGQSLTLQAGRNIAVDPGVTVSVPGTLTLQAAAGTSPTFDPAGGLSIGTGATLIGTAGIDLSAGTGGMTIAGNVVSGLGAVTLNSKGNITQTGLATPPGVLTAQNETFIGGATSVSITAAGNFTQNDFAAVLSPGTVSVQAGFITQNGPANVLVDTQTGAILGAVVFGSKGVTATSNLGVTQTGAARISSDPGATVSVTTGGDVNQSGSGQIYGDVTNVTGARILQTDAAVIGVANNAATGIVTVTAQGSRAFSGDITQSGHAVIFGAANVNVLASGNVSTTESASILGVRGSTAVLVQATGDVGLTGAASITGGATTGSATVTSRGANGIGLSDTATITGAKVALSASGAVLLHDATTVGQSGGGVDIVSGNGLIQAATSQIVAGTLTLNVQSASISGAGLLGTRNQIAVLGNSNVVAGQLTLVNAAPLTVAGTVNGDQGVTITQTGAMSVTGSVASQSGGITVSVTGPLGVTGVIVAPQAVNLTSSGDANLAGIVSSTAGSVNVTSSAALSLGAGNSVVASDGILLSSGGALTLGGTLAAPQVIAGNGGGSTVALDGTLIQVGGVPRPNGALALNAFPTATGFHGFYLTTGQFTQNGVLGIAGLTANDTPIARIDSGLVAFSAAGGLSAPGTWLLLNLGRGSATGNIAVAALDVAFVGANGGAALTGSVNGQGGTTAAALGNITPNTDARYTLNGCTIGLADCGIPPVVTPTPTPAPTPTPTPVTNIPTQPGTTQPGTTQPGTTQPGTTQPGTAQPGTTVVPPVVVVAATPAQTAIAASTATDPAFQYQVNGCELSSDRCAALGALPVPLATLVRETILGGALNPRDQEDLLLPLVSDRIY